MRFPTLLIAVVAVVLSGRTNATTAGHAAACGRELWDLKTLSDSRHNLVHLRPLPTTVAAINAKRPPRTIGRLRSRGFERHVWRVRAQITEYKLETDSDIHMVLFDQGAYIPSPRRAERQ